MDKFTVPQFIEHKAKIVGPLTFKQFVYIGIAGVFCFVLYFTASFFVFILGSALLILLASVLAFGKKEGRSLPTVLKNYLAFLASSKFYLWKKKGAMPPKIVERTVLPTEEIKEIEVPTITGKSRLNRLSTQVETKTEETTE